MELSQVQPVKLIVQYDNGQTLTFTIKALRRFLLHSQPEINGEVEKLLNITVQYAEVTAGREIAPPNLPPLNSGLPTKPLAGGSTSPTR